MHREEKSKISKLMKERSVLTTKNDRLRQKATILEKEVKSYKGNVKKLEKKIQDQRKIVQSEKNEMEREKLMYANKEKKYQNEARKREKKVEMLKEKLISLQEKQKQGNAVVMNKYEKKGTMDAKNSSGSIYTSAQTDFLELVANTDNKSFEKIKDENQILRTALRELQGMMKEVIKSRKEVIEKNLGDLELEEEDDVTSIREELFNLKGVPLTTGTLIEVRENIKKFRQFMEDLDVFKLKNMNSSNNITGLPGEKKSLDQYSDLIKNFKYVLNNQNSLLKKALETRSKKLDLGPLSIRDKLSTYQENYERVKITLEKMKAGEMENIASYEKARKLMNETNERIERERKILDVKFLVIF